MADDRTAVQRAADELAPAVEEATQAMLPLADLAVARGEDGREVVKRRGRPRGARNRRTEQMVEHLLRRYPHPLEALAQAYSRPTVALAEELGCKPIEAYEIQIKAARELAPYIASKMPVAVQVDQTQRFLFVMGDLTPEQAQSAALQLGAMPEGLVEDQSEQNQ